MLRLPAPRIAGTKKCFGSNTLKLEKWVEYLRKAEDNVVLMDCDMLVLRDFSDVFNYDFDIGLTVNGTGEIPYNCGVVFVRNNDKAKNFIYLWNKVNKYLFENPPEHNKWRNHKHYAGMNQAALGCLLETEKYNAVIKKFECAEWNLCKNNWLKIDNNSRIIHVKSTLRKAVFNTVVYGARSKKTGPAFFHTIDDWLQSLHPQIGILLTSETGRGQVFCGRAGTDRHWD